VIPVCYISIAFVSDKFKIFVALLSDDPKLHTLSNVQLFFYNKFTPHTGE